MIIDTLSVLILDGEDDLALLAARCLGQIPGWKIHILSTTPSPPVRFSRYQTSFEYFQPRNDQERFEMIGNTLKRTQADIMFPVSEAIRFASAHSDDFNKIGKITLISDQATFEKAVDKWTLAEFLMEQHIPIPATIIYKGHDVSEEELQGLSFPVLLKPIHGANGRGIEKFLNIDDLRKYLNDIKETAGRYVIQSFIQGHDINCNVLCKNGKILAHTIEEGVFLRSRAFESAAGIKFIQSEQAYDTLQKVMSALNWNGVANVDLRYDEQDKQVKVLEINPGFWGSLQGALRAGVNFPHLACLAAMGVDFPHPEYQFTYYVSGKVALQKLWQRYTGKSDVQFSFSETSWNYAIRDPLAEMRKLSRSIHF